MSAPVALAPVALAPAALAVADRLVATLMALARTTAALITAATAPKHHIDAAHALFARLATLVARLVSADALRPKRAEPNPPATSAPKPVATRRPARGPAAPALPRRPGWILDALPDTAPAIAAELGRTLADPALAQLLAAHPTLAGQLRPILRGLGLDPALAGAPPPPTPDPQTPRPPPHSDRPANRATRRAQASRTRRENEKRKRHRTRTHVSFVAYAE